MRQDPDSRSVASPEAEAFATAAGDLAAIDTVFPVLPFSDRVVGEHRISNLIDARHGEGTRHITSLAGEMGLMVADFRFSEEASGLATGRNFLKFHYKISGRNVIKFANRPDTLLESGRSVIAYHPEGLDKDDCFAADVREVSVTVGCRRAAVLDLLRVSADELPRPVRRYFDCQDSDFLCDELPLTPRMKEALAELNKPAFSPWLRKIHVEAKVLDLICMSLHELTGRDAFAGPTVMLKPRDIEMLRAVRDDLGANFQADISIAALCRKYATNRSKLSEGFRFVFGETIFEHLHKVRMEHARRLLVDTGTPISDIADLVGYSRQSSFSTAFREYHGQRPLDVRRSGIASLMQDAASGEPY